MCHMWLHCLAPALWGEAPSQSDNWAGWNIPGSPVIPTSRQASLSGGSVGAGV